MCAPPFIGPVEPEHLPQMRAFLVKMYVKTYGPVYGEEKISQIVEELHSLEALGCRLKQPRSRFIVAQSASIFVGCAHMVALDDGSAKLELLYILPAIQGQGLGRKLLCAVEDYFSGSSSYVLEVERENLAAIQFYEARGYMKVGTVSDCTRSGNDIAADVMEKTISAAI